MYLAFHILDGDDPKLMFTTQGQAGRVVSPDVVYYRRSGGTRNAKEKTK